MGALRDRTVCAASLAALACALLAPGAGAQTFSEWGTAGSGNGQFNAPRGIAVAPNGRVYVADSANHRIQQFSNGGTFILAFGTQGMGQGQLETPFGVALDNPSNQADDPNIYVADPGNDRVQKFSPSGTFLKDFGTFAGPAGVEVDATGHVFVVDTVDDILVKFAPNGTLLNVYGKPGGGPGSGPGQFNDPLDVDIDHEGDSWVADQANARIQELDPEGAFLLQSTASTDPAGIDHALELMAPATLLERVWVTNRVADTFLKLDEGGALLQTLGGTGTGLGQFMSPYGIASDCASDIFIVDLGNNRVQRYGGPILPAPPPAPCSAPANTVSPEIAGTAQAGSGLALDPGTWTGTPTPLISYRWQRCTSPDPIDCGDIAGERGLTYTVTDADRGVRLRAVVVAANVDGVVSEATDMTPVVPTVPITPLPPAPSNPPYVPITPSANPPVVDRTGFASFDISCNLSGNINCEVRGDLIGPRDPGLARKARRSGFLTLAQFDGLVRFGQTASFKLKLTGAGRKLVKAGYSKRTVLRVFVDGERRMTARVKLNRKTAKRLK